MTTNITSIINENIDQFDVESLGVAEWILFPEECSDIQNDIWESLEDWDWEDKEDDTMNTFEVIPFSQSEQDYVVSDEEYYGKLEGLVMGIQFEARNVRDRRFPVGKPLYFDVSYIDGVPEDEADFMNSYAEDIGWELTGRVVFRGYGTQHWWAEERDWYILDATPEQIAESRQYMAERDWGWY